MLYFSIGVCMKNVLRFLLFELILLYYELVFKVINFGFDFNISILYIFIFTSIFAVFLTLICGLFGPKVNKILSYILLGIVTFWFCLEIVFKNILDAFFSLSVLQIADQAVSFMDSAMQAVLRNAGYMAIFLIPIILLIIFRKKIVFEKTNLRGNLIELGVMVILVLGTFLYASHSSGTINSLFYKVDNLDMNMRQLGVLATNYLDVKKTIFDFVEDIDASHWNNGVSVDTKYNVLNYDFAKLYEETNNTKIKNITNYVMNDTGTKQNEYTGLFKGKNLIFIMAESFNEIAVDESITPTLYKLVNSGFVFENFYTPYNMSTIGGEYQDLTGLIADRDVLPTWRTGKNTFTYGLGNVFENLNYKVQAYHDHTYNFQDRDKYLKAVGFNSYMANGNGLEKRMSFPWPASDLDMVNVTVDDYINSEEPFMTYYVTVSGHLEYNFFGNAMAIKNSDDVSSLPYSYAVKAYYATHIELDRALESLINKLEEANKLDDTVIVLVADHYPYGLSLDDINSVSSYTKDSVIEINRSNLIIWNNQLETTRITKVASQIDVIPTVYNLFGIEYDSRLFIGKDILSDEPGLAIFSDRSWVSDDGKYFAASNKFVANKEVSDDYVDMVNNIVANKISVSSLIMSSNYYDSIKDYLNE